MNVTDMMYEFRKVVENTSKEFNGDDSINYPYAYGCLFSHTRLLLEELCLTDEQLVIMKNRLDRVKAW